jgi:Uma2 family endonuclease
MSQGATAEPGRREMTLAEWADRDEDAEGELVDGELVEEEEVGLLHDVVTAWLIRIVGTWLASRGGIMGVSDTRFGVAPRRGRKPDTYAFFAGRKPPAHGLVTLPPDIMVEVVSPRPADAQRDRVEKLRDYAVFGVKFYWIVDPGVRTFEINELGADGRYVHAAVASGGRLDEVPGCEGLVLDLDALWSEVDQLASPT